MPVPGGGRRRWYEPELARAGPGDFGSGIIPETQMQNTKAAGVNEQDKVIVSRHQQYRMPIVPGLIASLLSSMAGQSAGQPRRVLCSAESSFRPASATCSWRSWMECHAENDGVRCSASLGPRFDSAIMRYLSFVACPAVCQTAQRPAWSINGAFLFGRCVVVCPMRKEHLPVAPVAHVPRERGSPLWSE